MIFPVLLISNLESGILITPCPTHLQSQKKPGPEIEDNETVTILAVRHQLEEDYH